MIYLPSFLKPPLRYLRYLLNRLSRQRLVTKTINGVSFCLDLRESIDYQIYKHNCFEPSTTKALEYFCRPGMTTIDIGANIGWHALNLARLVGPSGRVIAFEPMLWAFTKLHTNLKLNQFTNLTLEQKALSDLNQPNQIASFAMSWPAFATNPNSLHPIHKGLAGHNLTDFITLDNYVQKHHLPPINLIKLDVDGYELKVLRGATGVLSRDHPVIITELGHYTLAEVGDKAEAMIHFLLRLNYQLLSEDTFKPFPNITALLSSIPPKKTINLVALPL